MQQLRYIYLTICMVIAMPVASVYGQTDKPMAKITFVELGSDRCIPCKQMQPILKSIQKKYGSQIKVVFHDVWKEDQKHFSEKYKIQIIPTQVFLDEKGKEFYRHEGFLPEKEIDKLLKKRGLKPQKG